MPRIRVYVYASDLILEAGLRSVLRSAPELEVLAGGEIDRADVAVVGVPGVDDEARTAVAGIQRDGCPRVVLIVDGLDAGGLVDAAGIGATGVVLRADATAASVSAAVKRVASGLAVVPEELIGGLLQRFADGRVGAPRERPDLCDRERDVLALLADGLSTAEIGRQLGYSERTVKGVVHDITKRLQLRNRSHAVAYALRNGMI